MARSKAAPAPVAPVAPAATASKDIVNKYQALCVSLDTLSNAARSASYAAGQYMEATFPGLKLGEQTFFGAFPHPGAVSAAVAGGPSAAPEEGEEEPAEDANPKRRKRVKSTIPKDPNAPKKPLTAYFAFAKAARQRVVQELPGATNREITEELATRWATMKDTGEQQPFRDQYAIEMQRYNLLLAAYKAKLSGLPAPEEEVPEAEVEVEAEPEEPEVEEEEEEEEEAPPPKPVTPRSAKGKKEKSESSKKKSKDKEKATPKAKSSRKRSTKDVTPPSTGEEEQQAAPAAKSPRKRKRKAAD